MLQTLERRQKYIGFILSEEHTPVIDYGLFQTYFPDRLADSKQKLCLIIRTIILVVSSEIQVVPLICTV